MNTGQMIAIASAGVIVGIIGYNMKGLINYQDITPYSNNIHNNIEPIPNLNEDYFSNHYNPTPTLKKLGGKTKRLKLKTKNMV